MDVRNKYKLHKKDLKKSNSKMSKIQKEEMEKLIFSFYAKLLSDLKKKHIFLEKYDQEQFFNEFNKHIEKITRENSKSDYNYVLGLVDKMIADFEKEKNKQIKESEEVVKGNQESNFGFKTMQPNDLNISQTNSKKRLIKELERKKNDEWSKLIQIEQNKFNKDMERKLNENLIQKEKFRLMLLNQIEEKRKVNELRKEDDKKLEQAIMELQEKKFMNENEKIEEITKRNRLLYKKYLKENEKNLNIKNEIFNKLNEEEKKNLNKSKSILDEEDKKLQEQLLNKKNEETKIRQYLRKQIKEKEKQKNLDKKSKEEDKSKNYKITEEVFKDKTERCEWYRISQKKYRELLDDQVNKRKPIPSMSEEERKINRKLFEEI